MHCNKHALLLSLSLRPHVVVSWLLGCPPSVVTSGVSAHDIPLHVRAKVDRHAKKIFDREAGERYIMYRI